MNITLLRARQWSLALLLVGLLNSEHLLAHYAVTAAPAPMIANLAVYHSPPSLTSRSSTTFFTPGIFPTRRFMAKTSQ